MIISGQSITNTICTLLLVPGETNLVYMDVIDEKENVGGPLYAPFIIVGLHSLQATTNVACMNQPVSFTAQLNPSSVTVPPCLLQWSGQNGLLLSTNAVAATIQFTNAGYNNVTARLACAEALYSMTIVGLGATTCDTGNIVTNGLTNTYYVCVVASNAPQTNAIVSFASVPVFSEDQLPGIWETSGGEGTNRLLRSVNLTQPGTTQITVSLCGQVVRVVQVVVSEARLAPGTNVILVNSDDDNRNGIPDKEEGATAIAHENDLMPIELVVNHFDPQDTVTLTGSGLRFWLAENHGGTGPFTTTNWPVSQSPRWVYAEAVNASASVNGAFLHLEVTRAACGCSCVYMTNLTAVDVQSVTWVAIPYNALSNNPATGGGLAIYADKPWPWAVNDYQLVHVRAVIEPPLPNVSITFTAFDVDDPSATNDVVDWEGSADNRGDGGFVGHSVTNTDHQGVAMVTFRVSRQPGDNYRVVAAPTSLGDFAGGYYSMQATNNGAVVCTNTNTSIEDRYQTAMLTVWRRLHVEMDSMAAVNGNSVGGQIVQLLGNLTAGATQAVLNVNLVAGLTPNDFSANLSSTTNCGRFQNGTMRIGQTGGEVDTANLLGNGDGFVQTVPGSFFNAPFKVVTSNGLTNIVGGISVMTANMGYTVFGVTATLMPNLFNGGTLYAFGYSWTVDQNSTNTIRVQASSITLPFALIDDDDNTILPHTPSIVGEFESLFRCAYIQPVLDGGGNPSYNSINVPFALNVNLAAVPAVMNTANALQSISNRSSDFWCAYVLVAFQFSPGPEQVGPVAPLNPPRGDSDPDSEANIPGLNSMPQGSILFWECFRECAVAAFVQQVIAHEVAHQFGVHDTYYYGLSEPDDVMGDGVYSPGARFYPAALQHLRSRVNSPGN